MSLPRKIIICANSSWNLFNYRSGLIRALIAGGYSVVALAPRDTSTGDVEALGCRFIELPMNPSGTGIFSNLRLLQRFLVILRRERPDYFLGFTIKPNIFGSLAARMLGIRYINNITGLGQMFAGDGHLVSLTKLMYKFALAKAQVVFFQNPDDRGLFENFGIVKGVQTGLLPGSGVDLDYFRCQQTDTNRIAWKPNEITSFVFISRMLRKKGVFEFYEAACMLRNSGILANFSLLGPILDGEEGVPLATIKKWHEEGVVTYLGETDDVRKFILAADCIVLPTFYREGVPRSLIEAAAMGRPLIATDVAGCREIVVDNKNGYLCAPKDANDLASKMQLFVETGIKSKKQMGAFSRTLVENAFDEKLVIRKYLNQLAANTVGDLSLE